jgi:hypothetical protein
MPAPPPVTAGTKWRFCSVGNSDSKAAGRSEEPAALPSSPICAVSQTAPVGCRTGTPRDLRNRGMLQSDLGRIARHPTCDYSVQTRLPRSVIHLLWRHLCTAGYGLSCVDLQVAKNLSFGSFAMLAASRRASSSPGDTFLTTDTDHSQPTVFPPNCELHLLHAPRKSQCEQHVVALVSAY